MSQELLVMWFGNPTSRKGIVEISLKRRWMVSLFVWLLIGSVAWPQTDRGAITRTVIDSTGAVVPGVKVVAMNAATNVKYSTTS